MNFEETEELYNVYRGILRNNRSFQPGKNTAVEYRIDCPEYADLLKKYPFEKIAGKGTDLQRAIRVLKYLSPKRHTARGTTAMWTATPWRFWITVWINRNRASTA